MIIISLFRSTRYVSRRCGNRETCGCKFNASLNMGNGISVVQSQNILQQLQSQARTMHPLYHFVYSPQESNIRKVSLFASFTQLFGKIGAISDRFFAYKCHETTVIICGDLQIVLGSALISPGCQSKGHRLFTIFNPSIKKICEYLSRTSRTSGNELTLPQLENSPRFVSWHFHLAWLSKLVQLPERPKDHPNWWHFSSDQCLMVEAAAVVVIDCSGS